MVPIFDAHLDLAWNALSFDRDQTEELATMNAREQGMTDMRSRGSAAVSLPEMRRGNIPVCLTTVLTRAKRDVLPKDGHRRPSLDYGTQSIAHAMGRGHLAYYQLLERQGHLVQLRDAASLRAHWKRWTDAVLEERQRLPIGYILSMEGADPIVEPAELSEWYDLGLRSLILAHYGQGHYADGTGGTGGLTKKGLELLDVAAQHDLLIDMTHTTDRSFDEVDDRYDGQLMASHNNCRALAPNQRQFTDDQIKRLVARGAVIGVVLDAWMLVPDWVKGESRPDHVLLAHVADHIDHHCQVAGDADHVGIGSDLDGGFGADQRPRDVSSIADLQNLAPILSDRGYSDESIEKIFYRNWLEFFLRHLP